MPKTIQKVVDVIKTAINRGSSKNTQYNATYQDGVVSLYHYGTLIFQARQGELMQLGGYSSSDRDAISTAMYVMGVQGNITSSPAVAKKYPHVEVNGWYVIR